MRIINVLLWYSEVIKFIIFSGQNITTIPKWVGITGIQGQISSIQAALTTIGQNTDSIFQGNAGNQFINTDPKDFYNNLTNLFNAYSPKYIK